MPVPWMFKDPIPVREDDEERLRIPEEFRTGAPLQMPEAPQEGMDPGDPVEEPRKGTTFKKAFGRHMLSMVPDFIGTKMVIDRGGYEATPLIPEGDLARGLVMTGQAAGLAGFENWLDNNDHKNWAKAVRFAGPALRAFAGIHNYRHAKGIDAKRARRK